MDRQYYKVVRRPENFVEKYPEYVSQSSMVFELKYRPDEWTKAIEGTGVLVHYLDDDGLFELARFFRHDPFAVFKVSVEDEVQMPSKRIISSGYSAIVDNWVYRSGILGEAEDLIAEFWANEKLNVKTSTWPIHSKAFIRVKLVKEVNYEEVLHNI